MSWHLSHIFQSEGTFLTGNALSIGMLHITFFERKKLSQWPEIIALSAT